MGGMYFVVEGIDGSGKTTAVGLAHKVLKDLGIEYVATREPGGTPLAESVREILLSAKFTVSSDQQALLFNAARSSVINDIVRPSLNSGKWVLGDRSYISNLVYQNDQADLIETILNNINMIYPDVVIYCKCPKEVVIKRLESRGEINHLDRLTFSRWDEFNCLYEKHVSNAKSDVYVLDTSQTLEDIEKELRSLFLKYSKKI